MENMGWFYTVAKPIYVGKHAPKIPEGISRAIPVWGTVEPPKTYYAPQVQVKLHEELTWKDVWKTFVKWLKKKA